MLFGSKKADNATKNWNAVRAKLAKVYGEDKTDEELVDAVLQEDEPSDDLETEPVEENPVADTKTEDPKPENTEGEDKKEIEALKKQVAALTVSFKGLSDKVAAIEKLPGRQATGGKREVPELPKQGEYTDAQAPIFAD